MTAITAAPAGRELGIRTLLVMAMAMPMLLLYAVSALGPQLVRDLGSPRSRSAISRLAPSVWQPSSRFGPGRWSAAWGCATDLPCCSGRSRLLSR